LFVPKEIYGYDIFDVGSPPFQEEEHLEFWEILQSRLAHPFHGLPSNIWKRVGTP
jgi:hypothetical protein